MILSLLAYEHMGRVVGQAAVRLDDPFDGGTPWKQLPRFTVDLRPYAMPSDLLEGLAEAVFDMAGFVRSVEEEEEPRSLG